MLRFYGRQPRTIFGLLGESENSATISVGWALEKSFTLQDVLVRSALNTGRFDHQKLIVALQRHGKDAGFSDIEIEYPDKFHLIIEAKRGWIVPSKTQLRRYANRLSSTEKSGSRIISLSAADSNYAERLLPKSVKGICVKHWSWSDLRKLVNRAYRAANSLEEKIWLRELGKHLEVYTMMQDPKDNQVYVVSLSVKPIRARNTYTWVDVVEEQGCYYHPIRKGWPALPPNYVAFRYGGELQSVHHVDSYKIVSNPILENPNWVNKAEDHFVYRLGPAMRPPKKIKTGKIYRSGRVWCAIDTLLSGKYKTISAARDATTRRLRNYPD